MSYLTAEVGSKTVEFNDCKTFDDVYYIDVFVKTLENKIKENKNAGLFPFDGIDFPDTLHIPYNRRALLAEKINESIYFAQSVRDQYQANNTPKKALDFIGKLDFTNVLDKMETGETKHSPLLNVLHNRLSSHNRPNLTASTAVWAVAYAIQREGATDFGNFSNEEIISLNKNGEKLEEGSLKALEFICSKKSNYGIHLIQGVLERSDLSKLDNNAKENIERHIYDGWGHGNNNVEHYIEQSPVSNLSEKALLKRKNITLNDIQTYYNPKAILSSTELLSKLDEAKEKTGTKDLTENMKKIRGQLAIQYVMGHGPKVDSYIVGKYGDDIRQGFKDNPSALKKLGIEIPGAVFDQLKIDEHFKNDIQFMDNSSSLDNTIELLEQIAKDGFSAGYAVEMTTHRANNYLNENKEKYEKHKNNLENGLEQRKEYTQVEERQSILSEMINTINQNLDAEHLKSVGLTTDEVLKMAADKLNGLGVEEIKCTDKTTRGLKGLFMGAKAKAKEKANIETKLKACNEINSFVKNFSEKFKNHKTTYEENNPITLLKKYSTFKEIASQDNNDKEYMCNHSNRSPYSKYEEDSDRKFINEYEKTKATYEKAQEKLESQMYAEISAARESNKTLDTEEAEKIYNKISDSQFRDTEKRNTDEQKSQVAKERYLARKILKDRGMLPRREALPVKRTEISREAIRSTIATRRI